MAVFTLDEGRIAYQRRDELVVIEAYGPNTLRFRASPNARLMEEDWNLLPPKQTNSEVKLEDNAALIVNGDLSARIFANGKVVYYKNGSELLAERSEMAFFSGYREYRHVEADNHKATVIFEAYEGEHFYGLGQEQNNVFDLKGSTSQLLHKNTKSSIPFVYSSRGYGFLWNNPSLGRCELTTNHTLWEANSCKQVDYLITAGDTPAAVMRSYAELTGYAPKFPDWASGFWQSRLRYENQDILLEVAREYKKRGIPVAAIVIDFFHWPEQGDWKFDGDYWPDPRAMCRELEEMGIKPIVSVWPTINPKSENYAYMDERNMLLRTERGPMGSFPSRECRPTWIQPIRKRGSMSGPESRKTILIWALRTTGLTRLSLKLDQSILITSAFTAATGRGGSPLSLLLRQVFLRWVEKEGQEEIISLTRAAWIGSQRVGSLVWSGIFPPRSKLWK